MKKLLSLVKLSAVSTLAYSATLLLPSTALACDPDPFIGTICYTAADFCPDKYSKAEGQELQISQNQALYSILSTYYGGNGQTTFNLPDLRAREAIGVGTGIGLAFFTFGQTSSMTEYTMTMQNMPEHVHLAYLNQLTLGSVNVKVSSETAGSIDPTGKSFGVSTVATYADSADSTMDTDAVQLSATIPNTSTALAPTAQTPISTIPPQLALTACIAMDGVYPPRS